MSKQIIALVDDHYVHGQIGLRWFHEFQGQLIIIVDNELVNDKLKQGLIEVAIAGDVQCRYYSQEQAITKLPLLKDKHQTIMLVFPSITKLKHLVKDGLHLDQIILTSVPFKVDDLRLSDDVSLSQEHIDFLLGQEKKRTKIHVGAYGLEESNKFADLIKKHS